MGVGEMRTDVVVIGGGIMGACTALWLARRGIKVTLCEKGEIGKEQSGRNWGWCRTTGRDVRERDLSVLSLRLWRDMNKTTGRETGFRQSGILAIAHDDQQLADMQLQQRQLDKSEAPVDLLDARQVGELAVGSNRHWPGGLYSKTDGRAEPGLAAPAIAEGARDAGAVIHIGCAVDDIETTGGRISGVQTSLGRIECSAVVIAGGAWSTKIARLLNFRFPQLIVNETVCRTGPVNGGPEVTLRTKAYSIRRRMDGGYSIGGGGKIRAELTPDSFRFLSDFIPILRAYGTMIRLRPTRHAWSEWYELLGPKGSPNMLDPKPDVHLSKSVCEALAQDFPIFRNAEVVQRWAGSIDVTPDALPVISPLPISGAYLISGFSGHGFAMGPGAGALMASLVAGHTPSVDPAPFHVSRLKRGQAIKLAPL